ncbi:MAG: cation:proton antiporter [Clostridia bacterium]|nr:cation:proton antiporter [Clostridia bacterium]
MHILFYVGIIIASGLIMGKVVAHFKLPHITGYLIAGVIIGPSILGLVPHIETRKMTIIAEIALGFIAYSIGCEFNFKDLKRTGKSVIIITIFQALGAVALVNLAMIYIFKQPIPFSIVLGAISTATAPGPILMIVKQYRAKGPLVDTLLPLVALDDALGIVIFGICGAIATSLLSVGGQLSLSHMILAPMGEIIISIVIGVILGLILGVIVKKIKKEELLIAIIVSILFIGVGLSHSFHASPILLAMVLGGTVCNIVPNIKNIKMLHLIENFTPPIYIAFFTLAGVELDIALVRDVGLVGAGYIIIRAIGKIVGSYIGSKIANSPKAVQKYLGFTLIPQAGVAIGLAMLAENILPPPFGINVRTIILAATVVYELVGPLIVKIAICRAGEANKICNFKETEDD